MVSVKVVARKKPLKDKTYPLFIRITKDGVSSYISLGHSTTLEHWDNKAQRVKKGHPNSARLNNFIIKKLSETNDKLLELQSNNKDTSSRTIRKSLDAAKEGTFSKQADIYIEQLIKNGKFNRVSADKPRIQHFKDFMDGDVTFSEITVPVLKKYAAWLKGTRGISDRTVMNHLVLIRSLYNQALAAGVADLKNYPYGKGKIVIKFPDSSKAGLSPAEIKELEDIELINGEDHARNLFLFSYYLAGVRISDVLRVKWADIQDGRLWYIMGKNNKGGSLKMPEKALRIIEKYRKDNPVHDLIFPDLEGLAKLDNDFDVQRRIKTRVHGINDNLKEVAKKAGITKKLTCHISRHSFASNASDKVDIRILQELYRHSHISTTIGYQGNFITKRADDALDAVIGQ